MELLEVKGVGKRYAGAATWALRDVDLTIQSGDVFGLVGENGAGKSTLLRLMIRLLQPTTGKIAYARGAEVGYVPELPAFWPVLTVGEQLAAVGRCAGMHGKRLAEGIDRMLRLTDLTTRRDARISTLSRGMLQRLGIAQAALPDPQLLVLDEPTSGLDPGGQRAIREVIQQLHREGKTILISSHYLVELEETCTRIGVVHAGRLVLEAAMDDLVRANRHRVEIDLDGDPQGLAGELAELGLDLQVQGRRLIIQNLDDDRYFPMLAALERRRLRILSMGHPGLLLEQIFLEAAGRDGQ